MDLFKNVKLPDSQHVRPVLMYLEAQARKDFSAAAEFFAEDVVFHGLILKASGRDRVAAEMQGFIAAAIEYIEVEAIAEVEAGSTARFLALYRFKLRPAAAPQVLCDHITVKEGRITRIENVFDVGKLPPM